LHRAFTRFSGVKLIAFASARGEWHPFRITHVMAWQALAVISAFAAGVTSVFAKAGLEDVPSHLGNAIRTAIVLALSIGVLLWSGEHRKTEVLTSRAWLFLALSGLATAVSWVAYFKALSLGSATPVTAIDKGSLVVTMLLALLFLGERVTWLNATGAALIVAGAIVASLGSR
jgi:transporter family protein